MVDFLIDLLPILIVGLSLGSLYGLAGLAFTSVVNASQLVNFAQGDFAVAGVAGCWFVTSVLGLPLWLGIIVAVFLGGLVGLLTERTIVTPLMKTGRGGMFAPILGTMAAGIIVAGVIGIYTSFYWMPIQPFIGLEPWRFGPGSVDTQCALIIIATVILVIGYWFFLNRTLLGTAFRASGFNREVSTLLGIQPMRMVAVAFIISGMIGGIAGVLAAPLASFTALDGLPLALNGFIALIIGGWGNPYAAVLGGVTLGLIRALLTGYFSSAHAELATFISLIFVLTLRPDGIFAGFMTPKLREKG